MQIIKKLLIIKRKNSLVNITASIFYWFILYFVSQIAINSSNLHKECLFNYSFNQIANVFH